MTPEDKAKLLNSIRFVLNLEWGKDHVEVVYQFLKEDRKHIETIYQFFQEQWEDDIFTCSYCHRHFIWDDSVKATGDIVEGKAGSPSETVCKGCAQNE